MAVSNRHLWVELAKRELMKTEFKKMVGYPAMSLLKWATTNTYL